MATKSIQINDNRLLIDAATCTQINSFSTYEVSEDSLPKIESDTLMRTFVEHVGKNQLFFNDDDIDLLNNNNEMILNNFKNENKKFRNYHSLPGKLLLQYGHFNERDDCNALMKSNAGKTSKSEDKTIKNSSVKIILKFNSNKEEKINKKKAGKKYNIEIEFIKNKENNLLAIKGNRNKRTQANHNEQLTCNINTEEEITNIKQIELNNYSMINNGSLQYMKTTTVRRSENHQPDVLNLTTDHKDIKPAIEPAAHQINYSTLFDCEQKLPIEVVPTSSINVNFPSVNDNQNAENNQSDSIIDNIVQNRDNDIDAILNNNNNDKEVTSTNTTITNNNERQEFKNADNNQAEDFEMIKLGLLLEMLNNSETNTYNALGITKTNDDLTNHENERDFHEFLEELGKSKLKKRFNNKTEYNDTGGKHENCYECPLFVEGNSKFDQEVLDRNMRKLITSMESINLSKERYCQYDDVDVDDDDDDDDNNNDDDEYGLVNDARSKDEPLAPAQAYFCNIDEDKRFRKAIRSILSFLVPSVSLKTSECNDDNNNNNVEPIQYPVERLHTVTTAQPFVPCKRKFTSHCKQHEISLWSKLNPFRLCFLSKDRTVRGHHHRRHNHRMDHGTANVFYNNDNSPVEHNHEHQLQEQKLEENEITNKEDNTGDLLKTIYQNDYATAKYYNVSNCQLSYFCDCNNNPLTNYYVNQYKNHLCNNATSFLTSNDLTSKLTSTSNNPFLNTPSCLQCPAAAAAAAAGCIHNLTSADIFQPVNYPNYYY